MRDLFLSCIRACRIGQKPNVERSYLDFDMGSSQYPILYNNPHTLLVPRLHFSVHPSTIYSLTMRSLGLFLIGLACFISATQGSFLSRRRVVSCLCEDEAWYITRRWLDIFSTNGGINTKAKLATIVSPNLKSYDATFGPPTIGIDQLWDALTAPGNATTTNVTQSPTFLLHSCDQIAYNWQYTAVTTGYNS